MHRIVAGVADIEVPIHGSLYDDVERTRLLPCGHFEVPLHLASTHYADVSHYGIDIGYSIRPLLWLSFTASE